MRAASVIPGSPERLKAWLDGDLLTKLADLVVSGLLLKRMLTAALLLPPKDEVDWDVVGWVVGDLWDIWEAELGPAVW